jgi:hypothetical protein
LGGAQTRRKSVRRTFAPAILIAARVKDSMALDPARIKASMANIAVVRNAIAKVNVRIVCDVQDGYQFAANPKFKSTVTFNPFTFGQDYGFRFATPLRTEKLRPVSAHVV